MDLVATAYRQFRQPTGVLGRFAGWIMAHRPSNVARNRWTVDLLQVQERDHVLEIGFGPGLAIERVARLAPKGRVVGIDHSPLMVELAGHKNQSAIEAGVVELKQGGFDLLLQLGESFDKAFSINVLQFLADRREALQLIRSVLKPEGLLATTLQPRHRGAKPEDAQAFAHKLSDELFIAGFRDLTVRQLDLKPVPAVCVLARRSKGAA
jgi:ubiquinone/menaquinone biosynthesis C-methylase UbiE